MAKAKSKPPSLHSRAARRASSPSLNLDKSIKSLPRPTSPTRRDEDLSNQDKIFRKVLDVTHRTINNGITKKRDVQGKRGNRTKLQKKRVEKGKVRAEGFTEILEKKTTVSVKKAKVIKERGSDWETVNSQVVNNPFAALAATAET